MIAKEKTKLWTKDFVLISLVNFLLFASWQMLPFVLPIYLQTLGASDIALGLITAVTTVAAILVRPFCGYMLDRFGRRGIFLVGILLMGLSLVAFAFFPILGVIFFIRFIHGLAWGVASTASQTVASDIIPPRRFGEGIGLFALSASLALAVAPGLSLEVFNKGGINPVLFIGIVAIAIAFIMTIFLRYRKFEKAASFSIKDIFEKKSLVPTVILFFLTSCYGALTTFLALHAANQGIENVGLFFTMYAIAVAISRPLLGKLVDRRGYGVVLIPGLIVLTAALFLLSAADSLPLFVLDGLLYGAGFAACNSTLQTMAVADVPLNRRGAANATYLVGFDTGIGVGAVVSGFIVTVVGYSGMYFCFAFLPIFAALVYFIFARHRKPPRLQKQQD